MQNEDGTWSWKFDNMVRMGGPGGSRSWSSAVTSTRPIPERPGCWPGSNPARTTRPNVRYIPGFDRGL